MGSIIEVDAVVAGARLTLRLTLAMLIVGAAAFDARERRLPNALAAALALASAALAFLSHGVGGLVANMLSAFVFCGALTAWELLWRRLHGGRAGMGMGDVKFTCALMLWSPALGALALVASLPLMAAAGMLLRRPSLPLIPFMACALMGLHLLSAFCG